MENQNKPRRPGVDGSLEGLLRPGQLAQSLLPIGVKWDYALAPHTGGLSATNLNSSSRHYFGKEGIRPSPIPLRSGPITLVFDAETGSLRYYRSGQTEVVRGIYGAVRDQHWNTIVPKITELRIEPQPDSFQIRFNAVCQENDVDFLWQGDITGDATGKIRFGFAGEAKRSFLRNRIGLCLLHPVSEFAGKTCMIEHSDGRQVQAAFPFFVAPHQPMLDVRAIMHETEGGLWVEIRFEGDTFEMEDQRNWGDASFKTYSTPLATPAPVPIIAGTKIQQSITISLRGPKPRAIIVSEPPVPELVLLDQEPRPLPPIGLGYASHEQALTPKELQLLQVLGLSHLRLDLFFKRPSWGELLTRASREARMLGIGLHLALHVTQNAKAELETLVNLVEALEAPVKLWMVLPETGPVASPATVSLAASILSSSDQHIPISVGSDRYFAELNRTRPELNQGFVLSSPLSPQAHAFDSATLVENLGSFSYILDTVQQFSRQPIALSPITLRPRSQPASTPEDELPPAHRLPPSVDIRQLSLFGAGWTLGALSHLIKSRRIHSLTFYETTGWLGIMEREQGSLMPDLFPSKPGAVYPMYHVFADLADCNQVIPSQSSHPMAFAGAALIRTNQQIRLLAANLTDQPLSFKFRTQAKAARIRFLDEISAEDCLQSPEPFLGNAGPRMALDSPLLTIKLLPFALVRIDLE